MKRKSIVFLITAVMMFTMMWNLSAFAADLPTGDSFEAPQKLTAELKERGEEDHILRLSG